MLRSYNKASNWKKFALSSPPVCQVLHCSFPKVWTVLVLAVMQAMVFLGQVNLNFKVLGKLILVAGHLKDLLNLLVVLCNCFNSKFKIFYLTLEHVCLLLMKKRNCANSTQSVWKSFYLACRLDYLLDIRRLLHLWWEFVKCTCNADRKTYPSNLKTVWPEGQEGTVRRIHLQVSKTALRCLTSGSTALGVNGIKNAMEWLNYKI